MKKLLSLSFLLLGVFAIGNFALAGVDVGLDYGAGTGLGESDPRVIAANVIRIALAFLGIVAVGLMVYAGFLWMTAAGNMDRIDTAKKILIGAVIGLVIVLSSFAIASYVLNRLLEATGTSTSTPGGGSTIPPGGGGVGTPCDDNTLTPVCEPSATICGAGLYCDPSSCLCRVGGGVGASCDSDDALIGCQADGSMCMPGLFCDTGTCTCETGSGSGESCDLDLLTAGCQMSTSTCSNLLTCDPAGCTCEEWPVIEWISPQGGFCDDEPNKSCRNDSDCTLTASSTCDRGTPNAAPGNVITIGGRYFGDTPGQVYFWNGSDFTLAGVSPSTLNPDCNSNWRDDQIIVVVPVGVVTGAIRVVRADLLDDESDNDQGPNVGSLMINTIRKPGLCRIDPEMGYLDDSVSYYGINFLAASEGRFGNYQTSLPVKNGSYVSALEVGGDVPNIQDGRTTTFVAGPAGDLSNYLRFTKQNESDRGPYIISFEPQSGAPGQYITIYGSGFGVSRGKSAVYFGDETGYEADYAFPEICADSVWKDNQVIVKVPASAPNANYPITFSINGKKVDTSSLSPNTFRIDRSLPLSPSLCKISPAIGDVGTPISLWGEHFDAFNTLSKVRFYNNRETSGAAITFWDLDQDIRTGVKPYRADTTVAPSAATGPVQVVKGASGLAGNGLNFRVGSCLESDDPNAACSPDICCPEGTYKSGRCAATEADCAIDVPSSVYEWDFNTGLGSATTDTGTTALSCAERSRLLDLCDVTLCPNSPGECSPFDNIFSSLGNVGQNCSSTCDQVGPCTTGDCRYDSVLDRCISNSRTNCTLPATTTDAYGAEADIYCEEYQGVARRVMYIDESSSCPNGWVRANMPVNGGALVCVNPSSSCTVCGGGYVCLSDGSGSTRGLCAAPEDICPTGSTCQADNKCKKVSADECQCCCRKANANQDCCAPLTCEGTCGSDRAVDTNTYGQCSGCRIEVGGVVDQTASDNACNCASSFGKYCDVNADPNNDGSPEGVCRDCAELSTSNNCSFHDTVCCVDAVREDICTSRQYGAATTEVFPIARSGGTSYCGYYACSSDNTACDATPDIGPFASTTNYFKSLTTCQAKCSVPALLGLSCAGKDNSSTCDASTCSAPGACLNDDGSGPAAPNSCGTCCCDPTNDQCSLMGNPNLRCQPDVGPCDGAGRGLCCGCSFNSDCSAGGSPTSVGCGVDQCCRARPSVVSTSPKDDQTDVCTNAELQATTDQLMNAESVRGNIVVVGEYATPCPNGTIYLAQNMDGQRVDGFSRAMKVAYKKVGDMLKGVFAPDALASDPPLLFMNYCAIVGETSTENLDPERGPTILKFKPKNLLDAGRKYFVIVKGDPALDNSAGVKSSWGIGMNIGVGSNGNTRVDNALPFNGIAYPSSYIWSFRTRPDQGGNKGICDIDKVVITPDSYLFSVNKNDLNEDDLASTSKSFDTVRDSDKKFTAKALSFRGETLFAAPGYSWNWIWNIVDPAVVEFVSGPFSSGKAEKLVRAKEDVTDRRTDITATVDLVDFALSDVGDGKQATSTAYVFLCENPWPSIAADGTWRPWRDNPDAMSPYCVTGSCLDMRYELYYCRDNGNPGTADDLPVLSSGTTRGQAPGSDVLKESYFFRQTPPTVESTNLEVRPIPRGGEVELNWGTVSDPSGSQTVSDYKVYYGTKSGGPYPSSYKVSAASAPTPGNPRLIVKDLDKTKDYYFSITAIYANGEESDYSNEVKVTPKDTLAPSRPTGVLAESPRANVPINLLYQISNWSRSSTERVTAAVSVSGSPDEVLKHIGTFDVRWGTALNDYPNVVSVTARQALIEGKKIEVFNDFATGTTYYFVVSATRTDGSSAEKAGAFSVVFSEDGSIPKSEDVEKSIDDPNKTVSSNFFGVGIPSGTMKVQWKPNTDDAVKYNLYWGTSHASYGQKIEVYGRDADRGKSYKETVFEYRNSQGKIFITVTAIDEAGNESERADEIILIPSQSSYTFRNALTNVGFEDGAIGGVPTDWGQWNCCNGDAKVKIGITDATSFSGSRSLRFWQAANVPYPGVCGSDLVSRSAPAYDAYPSGWLPTWNGSQCDFPDSSPNCGSCVVNAGQNIPWPWSNRVMWGKVVYNVTNLKWEVGEEYLVAFYYKGKLRSSTAPRFGYDLGWTSQCSPWNGSTCTYGSGWWRCSGDTSVCCHLPGQTGCYPSITMMTIPAGDYNNGDYNGWYLYFQTFVYTEELSKLYDGAGNNRNEVGMSIGYNNTGDGTEFFIDDFIVAQRVKE